jgi:hypothetical protein
MEYKGVLRVDLNSEEFCFQDLSTDKIFTNSKGQPLTLRKSVLFDEDNAYIDNPNEEGFKIPYMDNLRSEGFIDCLKGGANG